MFLVETLRAAHHNCQPTRRIMVYMAIMHSQWLREWERLGLLRCNNTKHVCVINLKVQELQQALVTRILPLLESFLGRCITI